MLKIGADTFPQLKIVATGSSTLAATSKFQDTLTGRKRLVHLTPVLWDELTAFDTSLMKRLYHGGLPQALLADTKRPGFYREWMDCFFARDIQREEEIRCRGGRRRTRRGASRRQAGPVRTGMQLARPPLPRLDQHGPAP